MRTAMMAMVAKVAAKYSVLKIANDPFVQALRKLDAYLVEARRRWDDEPLVYFDWLEETIEPLVYAIRRVDTLWTGVPSRPSSSDTKHVRDVLEGGHWVFHMADGGYSRLVLHGPGNSGPTMHFEVGSASVKTLPKWNQLVEQGLATPGGHIKVGARAQTRMANWVPATPDGAMYHQLLEKLRTQVKYNKERYLGNTAELWTAWRFFYAQGQAWAPFVLEHLVAPPGKAKAIEMAVRQFIRDYPSGKGPKDIIAWFTNNEQRLDLLDSASAWPSRHETNDGTMRVGPFEVVNTVQAEGESLEEARFILEDAARRVRQSDVPDLVSTLYGTVYLVGQVERKSWAAWYKDGQDTIFLRPRLRGVSFAESVRHFVHELAHRLWFKKLDHQVKAAWTTQHKLMTLHRPKSRLPEKGDILPFIVNKKQVKYDGHDGGRGLLVPVDGGDPMRVDLMKLIGWMSEADQVAQFPTRYSQVSASEHFAEAVSLYVLGQLQGDNLTMFEEIIFGRTPMAVRVASRFVSAKYKSKKVVKTKDGDEATVYVYSEKQIQHRNREKAKQVEKLHHAIGDLREQVSKDIKSDDPKLRLTALAVGLIDATFERVGNPGSADDGHYGVTGWLRKHIDFSKGKAIIRYVGKSGVDHEKVVDDEKLVSALKDCCGDKKPDDPILSFGKDDSEGVVRVSSRDVNAYLKPFDVTAKDLRGFHANRTMEEHLRAIRKKGPKLPTDRKEKDKILKAEFKEALEATAEAVGHEVATLRTQYLSPGVEDDYLKDGTTSDKLKEAARRPCAGKFYHVTPAGNLDQVLTRGLVPGGPASFQHLGLSGRVFFGQGEAVALRWAEKMRNYAVEKVYRARFREDRTYTPERAWQETPTEFSVVSLREDSPIIPLLRVDSVGTRDVGCSFYFDGPIPPQDLVREPRVERAIQTALSQDNMRNGAERKAGTLTRYVPLLIPEGPRGRAFSVPEEPDVVWIWEAPGIPTATDRPVPPRNVSHADEGHDYTWRGGRLRLSLTGRTGDVWLLLQYGSGDDLVACGSCGMMVPAHARFCPLCGASQKVGRVEIPTRKWVAVRSTELDSEQEDRIWQMYSTSYRAVGLAFGTVRAFLAEHSTIWCFDVNGDGQPDAFIAYKVTKAGFKITYIGHDGSPGAMIALADRAISALKTPGWWTESSHKTAAYLESNGFKRLDDEAAVRAILGKEIEWLGDGYYTRTINGLGAVRKAIYGHPRIPRVATKTPGEREDEAAEALIRPSPKKKPPRTDSRRHIVQPDDDPDVDPPDKDLSRNYKDV